MSRGRSFMTYRQRITLLFLVDTCIVFTAVLISWLLIFPYMNIFTFPIIISSVAILFSYHLFAVTFKLYKKVWEYASIGELLIILKIISYSIMITVVAQLAMIQTVYFR